MAIIGCNKVLGSLKSIFKWFLDSHEGFFLRVLATLRVFKLVDGDGHHAQDEEERRQHGHCDDVTTHLLLRGGDVVELAQKHRLVGLQVLTELVEGEGGAKDRVQRGEGCGPDLVVLVSEVAANDHEHRRVLFDLVRVPCIWLHLYEVV